MSFADHPPLNLLQRLDLALANRLTTVAVAVDELSKGGGLPEVPPAPRCEWIAGILGLRGLLVRPDEVEAVLSNGESRFAPNHHEYLLIIGMGQVYERIVARRDGTPPEGWLLVELFKEFTQGVPRFRNNSVRRDLPWDSILFVDYPDADKVPDCLDGFHRANCYTDLALRFENLHPVRQSFRMMWLFARIAPFPDFNLAMAWVAMNAYLVYSGYPMLTPVKEDRERLHRMIGGGVPQRIVAFESRLLETLETVDADERP